MPLTEKQNEIRMSVAWRVTSINQLLHYGKNEYWQVLGKKRGVAIPHVTGGNSEKANLSHFQKKEG